MEAIDPLVPPVPETERAERDGFGQFRTPCPWCGFVTEWCISWIASWAQLSAHYGDAHRSIQDALKARLP